MQILGIPSAQNVEFIEHMEDVLNVYDRLYDVAYPVECMDEQPTQLIEETRIPLRIELGQMAR